MQPIDLDRCRVAMRKINVIGAPTGEVRAKAIEDAIAAIQQDPGGALFGKYIGVKVYAGFGDQRSDHDYGRCPSHGTIVFDISRHSSFRATPSELGPDEIYLLECVRDFGGVNPVEGDPLVPHRAHVAKLNLCDVLRRMETFRSVFDAYDAKLAEGRVEDSQVHAG